MKIHFYKYQATGNDFVLIDNRSNHFGLTVDQIQKICDRKFGVGADGIMLIEKDSDLDFRLEYFNSDGTQSLCGNGSRAAIQFASFLGMINRHTSFTAYDGKHNGELLPSGIVRLKMNDTGNLISMGNDFSINTGSPHYIRFVEKAQDHSVFEEGRKIRYNEIYNEKGINVNFVEMLPNNTLFVRTYERGVENETLSCGTGVTAAALVASTKGYRSPVFVKTLGGDLSVEFETRPDGMFSNIYLVGPAVQVFEGTLDV